MLKKIFMVLPISFTLIYSISSAEPANEISTVQMRGYHGAGSHRSVQDLRNEKSPLSRERAITNGKGLGTPVTPTLSPSGGVNTPIAPTMSQSGTVNTPIAPTMTPSGSVKTPIAPTSSSTVKPTSTSTVKPTTTSPIKPTTSSPVTPTTK